MEGQLVRVLGLTVSTSTQVLSKRAFERVEQEQPPTVMVMVIRANRGMTTLEPGQLSHRGFDFATPETI